jgi:uncharacterized protein (TIGR03437 family)
MVRFLILGVLVAGALPADNAVSSAPFYTADSIVNSAGGVSGSYAPNTFITIYGQNLSFVTRAINSSDIAANTLPTALGGTGVRVLINALPAYLWYVSPTQVFLLIPSFLTPGAATVQLEVNGVAGPEVQIMLNATAPGLFLNPDGMTVIAQHLDYSLITADAPAHDGELIVLYAGGLGQTNPIVPSGQIPQVATEITDTSGFQVWLDGVQVDPARIQYVGLTPTYAGLYQINLLLPPDVPPNPEIRISAGDTISPGQRYLVLQ